MIPGPVRFAVGVTNSGFMSGTLGILVTSSNYPGPGPAAGPGDDATGPSVDSHVEVGLGAHSASGCKVDQYHISGYNKWSMTVVSGSTSD